MGTLALIDILAGHGSTLRELSVRIPVYQETWNLLLDGSKVSIGPVGQSHDQTAAPSLLPAGSPRPMLRAGFPGALPDRLRRWSSVDGAPTHAHSSAATGSSRDYTPA